MMEEFKHILFDEVYTYGNINSTMARSLKMIKDQQVQGNFLVVADSQSTGKGRNTNSWYSPSGGVYMSANFYGLIVESSLTLFVGTCIHKAILDSFPYLKDDLFIKWPNDIYLENLKICGVLSHHQAQHRYHSIGIGLNTNIDDFPKDLQDRATSLLNCLFFQIDNKKLIGKIFDLFSTDFPLFAENGLDYEYFNKYSFLSSKQITLDTDFAQYSGVCRGINKNGALLIQLPSKMVQPFYAGSVVEWENVD